MIVELVLLIVFLLLLIYIGKSISGSLGGGSSNGLSPFNFLPGGNLISGLF
jgi:hypothetical protein